ncbi:MAG: hypothetical protein IPJ13_04330 [Saprospiraceae bacterium]|nr:hypothetical protein [Saprospiraceae bacterium]
MKTTYHHHRSKPFQIGWMQAPEGNPANTPKLPEFPVNSLLGTPDLVLPFKKSYIHKGNGKDEYRYFVIPTGLTESKKIKAIELRPGNKKDSTSCPLFC